MAGMTRLPRTWYIGFWSLFAVLWLVRAAAMTVVAVSEYQAAHRWITDDQFLPYGMALICAVVPLAAVSGYYLTSVDKRPRVKGASIVMGVIGGGWYVVNLLLAFGVNALPLVPLMLTIPAMTYTMWTMRERRKALATAS